MYCGPEEGACSGWGTGGGLVSVDHRSSVKEVLPAKRQAGVWAEALHNQVEQYQFDMLGNRKRLWFSLQVWPVYRECAVGTWAAEIVNFWIRLFRTQISCCIYAFYSRWFVDEQVMTPIFNLVGVRDMDLTNTRRWQRAGKRAEGGWSCKEQHSQLLSTALGLWCGLKHNFSVPGPDSSLGREGRRAAWWKRLGVLSIR